MLNHLTIYLFQYKKVCLPHVGTLQLLQQPAQLNVAEKQIEPPSYRIEIVDDEIVPAHQLSFLNGFVQKDTEAVANDLRLFGETVRQKMREGGFEWEGIGVLQKGINQVPLRLDALQPVTAERVIRQEASHAVLVGDRETTSAQLADEKAEALKLERKGFPYVLVGWLLLVLAILFIAVWLFFGKFKTGSTGSRLPPLSTLVRPSTINQSSSRLLLPPL